MNNLIEKLKKNTKPFGLLQGYEYKITSESQNWESFGTYILTLGIVHIFIAEVPVYIPADCDFKFKKLNHMDKWYCYERVGF